MRKACLLVLSFLLLAVLPAAADDTVRNLRFSPGSDGAVVSGRIQGYDQAIYLIDVRAGQQLIVSMSASNGQNYFSVVSPLGTVLHDGSMSGDTYSAVAKRTGRYRIEIYLMRAAARRDESSRYKLSVTIPADDEDSDSGYDGDGDYADGYAGGPDRWIVRGVPPGDLLNMRLGPKPSTPIVGRLKNGAVVRNLGCRPGNGGRWCKIAKNNGETGWVNGRFLREY